MSSSFSGLLSFETRTISLFVKSLLKCNLGRRLSIFEWIKTWLMLRVWTCFSLKCLITFQNFTSSLHKPIFYIILLQDVSVNHSQNEQLREDKENCKHSFLLKDDLGYVCRICGIIDKRIETIFEFQYNKVKFHLVHSCSFMYS